MTQLSEVPNVSEETIVSDVNLVSSIGFTSDEEQIGKHPCLAKARPSSSYFKGYNIDIYPVSLHLNHKCHDTHSSRTLQIWMLGSQSQTTMASHNASSTAGNAPPSATLNTSASMPSTPNRRDPATTLRDETRRAAMSPLAAQR
jgi:hypothetical protein